MPSTPKRDFQNDLKTIRADVTGLRDAVGKLAHQASKVQVAMTKSSKQAVNGATGAGRKRGDEVSHLGRDFVKLPMLAVNAGMSSIRKQISANPVRSLLFALGLGFVAGLVGLKNRG